MAMYSSGDGVPDDFHLVHLGGRAMGGAGLVMVEMTCVSPEARITPACPGLWTDTQMLAFKRIVDFVHQNSDARIGIQLGHAGRKGSTRVSWEGRSEEHTSELQSLMRISYAVFCLKKNNKRHAKNP